MKHNRIFINLNQIVKIFSYVPIYFPNRYRINMKLWKNTVINTSKQRKTAQMRINRSKISLNNFHEYLVEKNIFAR